MEQKFLRIGQLATRPQRPGRLPFSPNSIWRLAREGKFPKPVKLSAGVTAWRLEDIETWEAERCKTGRDIACRKA
jgi:prophage regulatory protein